MLVDLPAPRLHDTIPDFHNTPKRYEALEQTIAADVAGRAKQVQNEIDFVRERSSILNVLQAVGLPERITHNDTKFNNVMLDDVNGEAICVVDLDTVMPGLVLHDFGDMVRTTTSPAPEDEPDLSKVIMQFPMFDALLRGYLSTAGDFLTRAEEQHLVVASKVIALEQGIRFLTDYIAGDTYYKVHRKGQNLDRCRTQWKLVASIEQQEVAMRKLLRSLTDL
jgi:aminoglycoside phosphotransferase (APT) family kinase protein